MKNIYLTIGGVVILILGFFAGYKWFHSSAVGALPTQVVNQGLRAASVTLVPLTATSSFVTNTDANDRIIKSESWQCTGLGSSAAPYTGANGGVLPNLILEAATTSSGTASSTNTNYILDQTDTVATGTPAIAYFSTSSPATLLNRIWLAGSSIQVWTNATNTASCNIEFSYLPT